MARNIFAYENAKNISMDVEKAHVGMSLRWEIYLRSRDKEWKLVWQGIWHENSKGVAQLCNCFVNVDERVWSWGILRRWISKIIYWGDIFWRGPGWKYIIMIYFCTKKIRKNNIAKMMTSTWGRWKGPPSASEWTFRNAGRSNAVQSRNWGREVSVYVYHENKVGSRFHRVLSQKSVKLWGRKVKCKV
jgi:hypothetical protein